MRLQAVFDKTAITGPILFIGFGLLAGPYGFGILDLKLQAVELRIIADMTLALVLFIDAANADLTTLRKHSLIPRRMLHSLTYPYLSYVFWRRC